MAVCEGCGADNGRRVQFCVECGRVLPKELDAGDLGSAGFFGDAFGNQAQERRDESGRRARPKKSPKKPSPARSKTRAASVGASAGRKAAADGGNGAGSPEAPGGFDAVSDLFGGDRIWRSNRSKAREDVDPDQITGVERTDQQSVRLTKSEALRQVAKAIVKAGAKSLTLSALVLGPGFALLLGGAMIPGMLWLFLGSFGLMAWTYRKPWRMGWIAVAIPPATALICYLLQLALFRQTPPALWLIVAIGIGVAIGYARGQAHKFHTENGSIFAQRTILYLGAWVAAYLASQLIAMTTVSTLAIRGGLVSGAMTTAMLLMVSIMLLQRWRKMVGMVALVVCTSLFAPGDGWALSANDPDAVNRFFILGIDDSIARNLPPGRQCSPTRSNSSGNLGSVSAFVHYACGAHAGATGASGGLIIKLKITATDAEFYWIQPGDATKTFAPSGNYRTTRQDLTTKRYRAYVTTVVKTGKDRGTERPITESIETVLKAESEVAYNVPSSSGWKTLKFTVEAEVRMSDSKGLRSSASTEQSAVGLYRAAQALIQEQFGSGRPNGSAPAPGVGSASAGSSTGGGLGGSVSPDQAAAVAVGVAMVLIAGGIAASVAQAVAAAIAQALQAGVQLTSEEIQGAIADALLRGGAGGDRAAAPSSDLPPAGGTGRAPPNVQTSERVRPPTPVYDEDGQAFETNDQGQYWAPDDKGNWGWLSRHEAQEASEALRAERAQRESEQAEFEREAEKDREDWRARKEEEAQQAAEELAKARAEREAREAAMERAEATRRENLTTSIFNALDNRDANERYSELMGQFATAQQDGDLEGLENVWSELRGERQQQLDALAEEAADRRGEAVWSQRAETAATLTRDGSKILLQTGLGVATGGTATALQAGGAMVVGATALTGIGAIEGGYREKDGDVNFDAWEAARGGARGALAAAEGMVGGVAANGSGAVMAGKVVFSGTSSYGSTYADTMDKTGNRDLAANRAGLSALAAMGGAAAGEYFDEASRLSRQRADGMKIDAPDHWGDVSGQSWGEAVDSVHVAENIRIQAGKDASSLLARTLGNISSSDQDISSGQAFAEALKSEALGKVAGKITGGADTGKRPFTGAQEAVIERLNAERMGLSPQPKPTPEYEDYMNSGKIRGAGALGASREDYVPVDVDADYTGGFNQAARRHGQRVADNLGIRIYVRPIDPEAGESIAKGEALPKPPELKANSGKDIDIELGMDPGYRNRVVVFDPKLPPRGDRSQEEWDALQARYGKRQDQYAAYADKIRNSSQFRLRADGLVVDRETGLPFAGDMDVFSFTGLHGEPVPRAVSEEAARQMMRNPAVMGQNIASTVEHPEHLAWDIGALDDTKIGPDNKTDRQRAIDINSRIVSDLRPSEDGPALAVFVPRPGMAPPGMEGASYTGAGPDTGPRKDG